MKRTSTESSREAFIDPDNKESRAKTKEVILAFLEGKGAFSNRQIAKATKLSYNQVQKRTSDLMNEGRVCIAGTVMESGRSNSLYQFQGWKVKKVKKKSYLDILQQELMQNWPLVYQHVVPKAKEEFQKQSA